MIRLTEAEILKSVKKSIELPLPLAYESMCNDQVVKIARLLDKKEITLADLKREAGL